MLQMVDKYPDYQFVIAGAPSQKRDFYQSIIEDKDVGFVNNKTYALLQLSHAALVTSGTATLETALFKVPQVVCYKANAISYFIAKKIITLNYISLVNLIMDEEIVTELIQHDLNPKRLKMELDSILASDKREQMLNNYNTLIAKLGGQGASEKAAHQIVQQLKS